MTKNTPIIEAQELNKILESTPEKVGIVDASWYLPAANRNALEEYRNKHIPTAKFFDLDKHSDQASSYPHMLADRDTTAKMFASLGLHSDLDLIVVYDGIGIFSAPRFYWICRAYGMNNVKVLNGGIKAWEKLGYPLVGQDSTSPAAVSQDLHLSEAPLGVCSYHDVSDNISDKDFQVVDARPEDRFMGRAPEPREGLKAGHIPDAINVPFNSLIDPESGKLLADDKLREAFVARGVNLQRRIVASCGSGVTASVLFLALEQLGIEDVGLYDGSWSEWGMIAPDDLISTK